MRVINLQIIVNKASVSSSWKLWLRLWLNLYDTPNSSPLSYDDIRALWHRVGGLEVTRIQPSLLCNGKKRPLDVYVFKASKAEFYLVVWCSLKSQLFFVHDVYSYSEYQKWCKHFLKKGKAFELAV